MGRIINLLLVVILLISCPAVFGMRNTIEDITMNETAEARTWIDMMKAGTMTTAVAMTIIAKVMKRDQTSEKNLGRQEAP